MQLRRTFFVSLFSSLIVALMFSSPINVYALIDYPENHCLSFDGANDYLSCGSSVYNTTKLTIEFWMKPKYTIALGSNVDYGSDTGIIMGYLKSYYGYEGRGGYLIRVYYTIGRIDFQFKTGGGPVVFSTNRDYWSNSSWYHVVFTYDPYLLTGNYAFYVNGAIDSSGDCTYNISYENGSYFRIGGYYNVPPANYMFGGLIDEVRVWGSQRSSTEILETWNRILNSTECAQTNLIGYWRFDEGFGAASEDLSSQNNDAIFAGPPYDPSWVDSGAPIVPEFPSFLILPFFMTLTLIAVLFYKRKYIVKG